MQTIPIRKALKRVTRRRILSYTLFLFSFLLLICGALKGMYGILQNDVGPLSNISNGIRSLIYQLYEKTDFLAWFWNVSPVPDPRHLNSSGNWGVLFILMLIAIAAKIRNSATALSTRIKETLDTVEQLRWQQELMGQQGHTRRAPPVPLLDTVGVTQQVEWFQRPAGMILIAVAATVLGQWANLQLGLVKL